MSGSCWCSFGVAKMSEYCGIMLLAQNRRLLSRSRTAQRIGIV